MTVLCQWCGAANPDDRELCQRCRSKLLVVSGPMVEETTFELEDEDEALEAEGLLLHENLLERVSASEDAARRLQAATDTINGRLADLEHGLALLDAGIEALIELLDRRRVVRETEVMAAWERAASSEMTREELLDKLRERRDVIVSRARTGGPAVGAAYSRAVQTAELALLAGRPLRAREILGEVLRRGPHNPELAMLLGEMAFDSDEPETAEHYFGLVTRWEPANVQARIYLGTLLADSGRTAEAQRHLTAAAELAPDHFLPHLSLGALFATMGELGRAREQLNKAASLEKLPQAYFLLGTVELQAGRSGAAVKALEEAVALGPDFEDAIYQLGIAYLERGWHRKALDCFRRLLDIDPQRLQYQEAVQLLETSGGAKPPLPREADALLEQASEAVSRGEIDRAVGRLQRAVRVAQHPSLLASLALLAASAGKHRQALAAAHALLRQNVPGAPRLAAWTALLETLRAVHRWRAVERWGERLLNEGADAVERAIAGYELALNELERGGDVDRALDRAHASLQLMPRELRHYPLAALGRVHMAREEYSDAVDYLQQAAELSPSPSTLTQLGLALLAHGEGERARDILQQARTAAGRDLKTDVLTHLARVGWWTGHGRRKGS